MEKPKNSEVKSIPIPTTKPDLIKRLPFNGRSKHLIDRFYIIGYRPNQLHKILFQKDQYKKSLENQAKKIVQEESLNPSSYSKSQFNPNASKKHNLKIIIDESPSLLNEISSNLRKELADIDIIKNMLFPNKINVYLKPEFIKKNQVSRRITINEGFPLPKRNNFPSKSEEEENEINKSFTKEEDEENNNNLKIMNTKQYNMVFSYNPQSGKNSKKSINGFAYVFYKEFSEKEEIGEIKFTFYVPVTFCIISEFPYFNSYYRLCKQIVQLFQSNKNEIPLEILLYNIINFCPSPINGEVILNIEPTNFPTEKIVVNSLMRVNKEKEKQIHIIKEEEEPDDDYKNPYDLYENDVDEKKVEDDKEKNVEKYKEKKLNSFPILKSKTTIYKNNQIKNILKKAAKAEDENKNISPKKKVYFTQSPRNTIGIGVKTHKLLNLEDDFDNIEDNNSKKYMHLSSHDDIKFQFLSGYPLIQYNLTKILLHK